VTRHGVRTTTLYQPTIDYPELNMAAQITDDQHTPYNTWSRWEDTVNYGVVSQPVLRMPDPEIKKAPDPGSATLLAI
jgi:hypothetical protein